MRRRPLGVTTTTGLMVLSLLIMAIDGTRPHPVADAGGYGTQLRVIETIALMVSGLIVWLYYSGSNVARWFVMAESGVILCTSAHLPMVWSISHMDGAFSICNDALSIYLLWYLNSREVRAWFHSERSETVDTRP